VIALLISILLPTLSAAKAQARDAVCQANLRQLALGVLSYTAEEKGFLPGNAFDYFCDWLGTANRAWGQSDDVDDAPQKGTLFKYVGQSEKVYFCPSHERFDEEGSTPVRRYSYTAPLGITGAPVSLVKRVAWEDPPLVENPDSRDWGSTYFTLCRCWSRKIAYWLAGATGLEQRRQYHGWHCGKVPPHRFAMSRLRFACPISGDGVAYVLSVDNRTLPERHYQTERPTPNDPQGKLESAWLLQPPQPRWSRGVVRSNRRDAETAEDAEGNAFSSLTPGNFGWVYEQDLSGMAAGRAAGLLHLGRTSGDHVVRNTVGQLLEEEDLCRCGSSTPPAAAGVLLGPTSSSSTARAARSHPERRKSCRITSTADTDPQAAERPN
jgi:hypothetical protein